jgi:cysteine sulfinate desulfinase/cysteine desulfurase-like protein
MGLSLEFASRALRISSGWATTAEDWDALLSALVESDRELNAEAADSESQVISI